MAEAQRALPPPDDEIVVLTDNLVDAAVRASRDSERRRMVLPFHRTIDDPLRRMFNALQPDSYVRPHRHAPPSDREAWLVVRGALALVLFDDAGFCRRSIRLGAASSAFGVDFLGDTYHGVVVLEPDTVIYEVKLGPYAPNEKDLAPWAPGEASSAAPGYLERLRRTVLQSA